MGNVNLASLLANQLSKKKPLVNPDSTQDQLQPPELPEDISAPEVPTEQPKGNSFKETLLKSMKGVGDALDFAAGQSGDAKDFDFIKRLITGATTGEARGIQANPYEIAGAASSTLSGPEQEVQKKMYERPDLQDLLPGRNVPFIDTKTGDVVGYGSQGSMQGVPGYQGVNPQEAANSFVNPSETTKSGKSTESKGTILPATSYNLENQKKQGELKKIRSQESESFGTSYPGDEIFKTAAGLGKSLGTVDTQLFKIDRDVKSGDIFSFRTDTQLALDQLKEVEGMVPRGTQAEVFDQAINHAQSDLDRMNLSDIQTLTPAALNSTIKNVLSLRDLINKQYDVTGTQAGVTKGSPDYNRFLGIVEGSRPQDTILAIVGKDGKVILNQDGEPMHPLVVGFDNNGIAKYGLPKGVKGSIVPVAGYSYENDAFIQNLRNRVTMNKGVDNNDIEAMKTGLAHKSTLAAQAQAMQTAAGTVAKGKAYWNMIPGLANGGKIQFNRNAGQDETQAQQVPQDVQDWYDKYKDYPAMKNPNSALHKYYIQNIQKYGL